jgi:stage IV sporulation protein FB
MTNLYNWLVLHWKKFAMAAFSLFVMTFLTGGIKDALFLACLFMIHEGGHALVARYFRYEVTSVWLFPFGASVSWNDTKKDAFQRSLISLGGPATGIILSLFMFLAYLLPLNADVKHNLVIAIAVTAGINVLNLAMMTPFLDGSNILASLVAGLTKQQAIIIRTVVGLIFAIATCWFLPQLITIVSIVMVAFTCYDVVLFLLNRTYYQSNYYLNTEDSSLSPMSKLQMQKVMLGYSLISFSLFVIVSMALKNLN